MIVLEVAGILFGSLTSLLRVDTIMVVEGCCACRFLCLVLYPLLFDVDVDVVVVVIYQYVFVVVSSEYRTITSNVYY